MAISLTHPLPSGTPTAGYGWRPGFTENGVYVPPMLHNGQDYGAPAGTPILAAHSGKVIWAGWDSSGGGNGIQIQSDDGYWSTLYFHMNAPTWRKVGERIVGGKSIIGHVGMTGLATGNHLHFMLRSYGSDINPVPYIRSSAAKPTTPKKGKEVIAYHREDKFARSRGRIIKPGAGLYLHTSVDDPSKATNVVGGIGQYSITPHVYATGEPGEAVDLVLIWQTIDKKTKKAVKNSQHYTERLVFDKEGRIHASREFKRYVGSKTHNVAVYVRLEAPKSNKKDVKVTLLDSDAFLFTS